MILIKLLFFVKWQTTAKSMNLFLKLLKIKNNFFFITALPGGNENHYRPVGR